MLTEQNKIKLSTSPDFYIRGPRERKLMILLTSWSFLLHPRAKVSTRNIQMKPSDFRTSRIFLAPLLVRRHQFVVCFVQHVYWSSQSKQGKDRWRERGSSFMGRYQLDPNGESNRGHLQIPQAFHANFHDVEVLIWQSDHLNRLKYHVVETWHQTTRTSSSFTVWL